MKALERDVATLKTPVGAKADHHDIDSELNSLLSSFTEDDMRDPYADYSMTVSLTSLTLA